MVVTDKISPCSIMEVNQIQNLQEIQIKKNTSIEKLQGTFQICNRYDINFNREWKHTKHFNAA